MCCMLQMFFHLVVVLLIFYNILLFFFLHVFLPLLLFRVRCICDSLLDFHRLLPFDLTFFFYLF